MQVNDDNKFYNLIGMTSLVDVVDLLAHCKRVVTNDSGLMHVAAAVQTPLVALYGPSSPEYTPPLIDNKKVIRKMDGYQKIRKGIGKYFQLEILHMTHLKVYCKFSPTKDIPKCPLQNRSTNKF